MINNPNRSLLAVPVSTIAREVPAALSLNTSDAFRVPVALGLNVTVPLQVPPTGRVFGLTGQLFDCE